MDYWIVWPGSKIGFGEKTDVGRTSALESGVRVLEDKMLAVERLTEGMKKVESLENRVSVLEGRLSSGRELREEKGGRSEGRGWERKEGIARVG